MSSRDVLDGLEVDRSGSIQDAWCSLLMCFLNISHVLETASREMSSYLSSAELSSRRNKVLFEVEADETLMPGFSFDNVCDMCLRFKKFP